jgi:hypothetical protein
MATTVPHQSAPTSGDTSIRPFHVEIPREVIDELRRRVQAAGFPRELYQAPRSWAEQAYPNLIYFNEVDEGNHFAAWQEPELFTTELRAAFSSLRDERRSS